MQLEGEQEDWRRWVMKDPSPTRVHLAAVCFNWDDGMDFLVWIAGQSFLPRASIFQLISVADLDYYEGVCSKEEAIKHDRSFGETTFQMLEKMSRQWTALEGQADQISPDPYWVEVYEKKGKQIINRVVDSGLPFPFLRKLDTIRHDLPVPNYQTDLKGEDRREFWKLNSWIYEE